MRSYVAIHLSLVFAVGALITGSIWAKASWGHWWVWDEPVLVSFLIVFLLYCCYQPLRFSIEDPERQARYASVFAIAAGAFVPINFMAVRLATAHIHPRVLRRPAATARQMRLTFLVSLRGRAAVHHALEGRADREELVRAAKKLRRRLEGRRRAAPPAPAARAGGRATTMPVLAAPRAASTWRPPTSSSSRWC